jgi:hypothetical protein
VDRKVIARPLCSKSDSEALRSLKSALLRLLPADRTLNGYLASPKEWRFGITSRGRLQQALKISSEGWVLVRGSESKEPEISPRLRKKSKDQIIKVRRAHTGCNSYRS